MRPGLVFLGLFAFLTAIYAALSDTLQPWLIFPLRAAIIVLVLAAALWLRGRTRRRHPPSGTEASLSPSDGHPEDESAARDSDGRS